MCTHKSEKVSVAYVYSTKRPSEASCFFFPDATVACVPCVREWMGRWGEGDKVLEGGQLFLASRTNSQEAWFKKLLMWHMEYMEKVFDKWKLLCVCYEEGFTMSGLFRNLKLCRCL